MPIQKKIHKSFLKTCIKSRVFLLQVCGINMRNATHEHAVTVLRQCGDNLTMKVQYNPESESVS